MMDEDNLVVADVRSEESFELAHIPSAAHLTIANLDTFCMQADKSKPVMVYCYHGISSQAVAEHLVEQGFVTVYSLVGGFEAWEAYVATLK